MKKRVFFLFIIHWITVNLSGQQIINHDFEVIDKQSPTLAKSWSFSLKNSSLKMSYQCDNENIVELDFKKNKDVSLVTVPLVDGKSFDQREFRTLV